MEGTEAVRLSRRGVMAAGVVAACAGAAACQAPPRGGATTPDSPVTVKAADIPVGGGTIFDSGYVVTQPKAGQFKAFSAICTHAQCFVTTVQDGSIHCPCHGSRFSITDGSVLNGPAIQPLPPKTVTANGDSLTVS